jgi:drug/metabolite transporter (DMT)-like permease
MRTNKSLLGVAFIVLAMLVFSLQDIAVKWMGGNYPALEIVIFRSLVALPCTLLFFRNEGGRGLPTTQRHKLEYVRGFFYFLSFTTYMMGVAALPLGDVAAIRNSAPLMIALLSVVWLGERVDLRRWLALVVGFVGVLLIVRPGSATFNLGSVFSLIATLFYAINVIITRKLQNTDSSATMAYYSSLVYLAASIILAPLSVVIGPVPDAHPSIAFLLHPWSMPTLLDWAIISGLGLVWAVGMYCVARAYSLAQASLVAPFEYVLLPINVMWSLIIWRDIPTWLMLAGALLTLLSGIYVVAQERKERRVIKVAQNEKPDGIRMTETEKVI